MVAYRHRRWYRVRSTPPSCFRTRRTNRADLRLYEHTVHKDGTEGDAEVHRRSLTYFVGCGDDHVLQVGTRMLPCRQCPLVLRLLFLQRLLALFLRGNALSWPFSVESFVQLKRRIASGRALRPKLDSKNSFSSPVRLSPLPFACRCSRSLFSCPPRQCKFAPRAYRLCCP